MLLFKDIWLENENKFVINNLVIEDLYYFYIFEKNIFNIIW